ncbi:MAG: DUF4097 family beta strand repeat protein [Oscillospiraceae bacterium]|nr:DUF4097 family beta strand repeat protein [Oscillospiraceae bacterium]
MKYGLRIAIAVAACLIVAGLILGGIALLSGGFRFDGLQIGFGSKTITQKELTPRTYPVTEPFQAIDVRSASGDVELRRTNDGSCRIECMECEGWTHKVEVRGGTLYVERESITNINLILGTSGRDVIELWLPETVYDALAVGSSSGDVKIPGGYSFGTASVSSTSGDIDFRAQVDGTLNAAATSGTIAVTDLGCYALTAASTSGSIYVSGVDCGSVSMSCTSGDISLENVAASGELITQTTSGDIRMKDVTCRTLNAESTSGEKTLTDVVSQEDIRITSSSGDLTLTRCDALTLHIKSSSGEVTGSLRTEKTFITHTTSGGVNVPTGRGGDCEIETTSGDIRITISG